MSENLSPIGFWSYACQDDEEKLSGLRSILQRQLQQKYGREPIKIFQDVAAIPPGADWNHKITEALHSSTFLIPIITPNFSAREWGTKTARATTRSARIFKLRHNSSYRNGISTST